MCQTVNFVLFAVKRKIEELVPGTEEILEKALKEYYRKIDKTYLLLNFLNEMYKDNAAVLELVNSTRIESVNFFVFKFAVIRISTRFFFENESILYSTRYYLEEAFPDSYVTFEKYHHVSCFFDNTEEISEFVERCPFICDALFIGHEWGSLEHFYLSETMFPMLQDEIEEAIEESKEEAREKKLLSELFNRWSNDSFDLAFED